MSLVDCFATLAMTIKRRAVAVVAKFCPIQTPYFSEIFEIYE
ncbi:hypothetical protein OFN73_08035 [Campylobacter sp. JMF_14 EL1]|nr:hypothetical protein [Campylobacter sp. JMF_14 EL1]